MASRPSSRHGWATTHFALTLRDVVIVRILSAGRTLEGRLEWQDANGASVGEQRFPSRTGDCAELARAMGFALALQIQLRAATIAESTSAATTAPPMEVAKAPAESTAPSPIAPVESPKPAMSEPPGPSVLVGGGALAGFGISSKPIMIGRLFATVAWTHAALELGGEVSAPSTTNRADGAGFSQETFLASLAGCGVSFSFSLCAVGKVGELRMVGQGVDVPLTASGLLIQSGLRLASLSQPRKSCLHRRPCRGARPTHAGYRDAGFHPGLDHASLCRSARNRCRISISVNNRRCADRNRVAMAYLRQVRSALPRAEGEASCIAVYQKELDYLFETLQRLGASPREIEDLAHEVFLVLLRNWSDLDLSRPFRPYLFAIAFRVVCAHRRRRRREVPYGFVDTQDQAIGPEESLQSKESVRGFSGPRSIRSHCRGEPSSSCTTWMGFRSSRSRLDCPSRGSVSTRDCARGAKSWRQRCGGC